MKTLVDENQKKWALCVARAWADEDYKKRLLSDSAKALKDEGINLPEGINIKVVENTQSTIYMVLPAAPESEDGAIENVEERLAAMSCLCLCLLGPMQAIGDLLTGGLTGR